MDAATKRTKPSNAAAARKQAQPAARKQAQPAARKQAQPDRTFLSADERRAKGRALRDIVPRVSHGGWKAPKTRRDPLDIISASNEGRMPELVPIRFGRMLASPFAFYRGGAAIMAADLAGTPTSGLTTQACGDAHLMNFGGFATPERNIIFDISDLDETLPAPFEWDLKRLAASVVIAAQHLQFAGSDAARLAVDVVREYRERMDDYSSMRALEVWYDRIDLQRYEARAADPAVVKSARKRLAERIEAERRNTVPDHLFPKLTTQDGSAPRIKENPPLIFHPTKELAPGLTSGYREVIAGYRQTLPEHTRTLFDRFHFVDLAMKVVGVGSVGTQCLIALFMAADDDPLFLQVKEARASVLEPYAGRSAHANHGQRVIAGQRLMQAATDIFLGWTRGSNGRDYYVRQLRDMKMSAIMEDWDVATLRQYGRMCAHALARAHARSGDAATMSGYMGSSQAFDEAVGEFGVEYADQNRADYRAFVRAAKDKRIEVLVDA